MTKLIECRFFQDRIAHFQADEVPADQRERLQHHLETCEECSARLKFEEGMRNVIVQRLSRVKAPPGLETRIRASLAATTPDGPAVPLFRRPWFAAVAASVLLAVMVLAGNGTPGPARATGAAIRVADQLVVVVDRDCERAGRTVRQQRDCRNHKHLNMLKVPDGNYWFVSLDREAGRRILLDPDLRGRQLMVAGDLYRDIGTLRLTSYRQVDDGDHPSPTAVSL